MTALPGESGFILGSLVRRLEIWKQQLAENSCVAWEGGIQEKRLFYEGHHPSYIDRKAGEGLVGANQDMDPSMAADCSAEPFLGVEHGPARLPRSGGGGQRKSTSSVLRGIKGISDDDTSLSAQAWRWTFLTSSWFNGDISHRWLDYACQDPFV